MTVWITVTTIWASARALPRQWERESAEGRETLHSFSKKSYSFVHPLSFRLSLSGAHWSHKPHESSSALARLMSAWLCFFSTIKFWLSFRTVMRDMNLNLRSSAHTLVQYCRMRLWEDFHICICSYITCLVWRKIFVYLLICIISFIIFFYCFNLKKVFFLAYFKIYSIKSLFFYSLCLHLLM